MKNNKTYWGRLRITQRAAVAVTFCVAMNADTHGQEALPAPLIGKGPAQEMTLEKALEAPVNWIDFAVGGVLVDGDDAQFQRRHQVPATIYGGIEGFHFEQAVRTNNTFKVDGRAIFDNHDYLLKVEYDMPERARIRVGYREFRTWYDGSGGFFPQTGLWFSLFDDELSLDRGEAWIEGSYIIPDGPTLTLRYSHQFREGKKDSTSWGDTDMTGGLGVRGIVPSFRDIDETRDIIELEGKHTISKTDVGLGLRYETWDIKNSLNVTRRPGEASARFFTHREGVETDLFSARAFSETRFNEKALLTTAYAFTTLDTDLSGSRIYGSSFDPVFDPLFARRQRFDEGFLGLSGGSQMKQHLATFNVMLTPWENVAITPSVRIEKSDLDSSSHFVETVVVPAGPGLTTFADELAAESDRGFLEISERLELRYTGVTNWVFYGRGDWAQGDGDLFEQEIAVETGMIDLQRDSDFTRFTQKYTAGANWYPLRRLNLAVQYYHKIHENEYDHRLDSTPNDGSNRYPAYIGDQDFTTDDVNFRVTWRPANNVTLVGRYDFQLSTIDTVVDLLSGLQSSESTAHIFSQSITWSPISRLYLQGSINYVLDETETPFNNVTGPLANVVLKSENDYWNTSVSAGYALTDKTDIHTGYFYYRADNYVNNSAVGQPFGAGAEEHGVSASLVHRISENLQWTLKYAFLNHDDPLFGGYNNFDAHLIYSSIRYRF